MANIIQIKRGTGSSEPSNGSLAEGELAINLDSGKLFYGSGSSVLSDFKFDKLTTETHVISSSVTYMTTSFSSGSTAFGDTADDTHTFTGDITASGNISSSGYISANKYHADEGASYGYSIGTSKPILTIKDTLNLGASHASYTAAGVNIYTTGSDSSKGLFLDSVGNMTASGDISASGIISAEHFYSSDDIVAAGDISASAGNVYGASVNTPRINPEGATNVYISAGIQVIGDITGSTTITVPSRVYAHPGTNAGDHTAGDVWYFGGTTGMTAGLIYYLNTSGTWTVTNCDDVDDSTGMLAVALGDESDNDGMLLRGFVTLYEIQGTEDHGKILYLNQTDGGTSIVAPTTSGHVVRIIGYAIHNTNDSVYFNPDNTWVEIA